MKKNQWFEVDAKGLAELQAGKPKIYIVRELIANAWDENITECHVRLSFSKGKAIIEVEDDCPEGFADLKDSFTLFKHTTKRADPNKRGRFNLGEKQSISVCESATISTTKGTVTFDKKGRHMKGKKRHKGSKLTLESKMLKSEFEELFEVENYLPPSGICFTVNGKEIKHKEPYKIIGATLLSEIEKDNILKKTMRKTQIFLHKAEGKARLYEMGIPIQEIDCQFDIDVQQKIPLGIDRETVLPSFLKDVFAEVLNCTFDDVENNNSSDLWVRTAISDERIKPEAVKEIITKRYGEKVCVANPFDKKSIDEAISEGYRVIQGREMDKKEWNAVKKDNIIQSSSELFGHSYVGAETINELNSDQLIAKELAEKIAKRVLSINLKVVFLKSEATAGATFESGNNVLSFNMSRLGKNFFSPPVSVQVIDLILHELGHFQGRQHTEKRYHQLITKMAGQLIIIALEEPDFFKISGGTK